MTEILCCDWLPKRARLSYLARSGLPAVSRKNTFRKPYNKSFIDQACSVKMAAYCPRSFFTCQWTSTWTRKKELGQYPAILTSHLVNNPYQEPAPAHIYRIGLFIEPKHENNTTNAVKMQKCLKRCIYLMQKFLIPNARKWKINYAIRDMLTKRGAKIS